MLLRSVIRRRPPAQAAQDDDGIGTYTGKHGGRESLGTRINGT